MKKSIKKNTDNTKLKIGTDLSHKYRIKKDITSLAYSSYDSLDIHNQLAYGKKTEIAVIIKNIRKLSEHQSIHFIRYIFIEILFICSRYISELGGNIVSIVPETENYNRMLDSITSVDSLCLLLDLILTSTYDYRDSHIDILQGNTVAKAQKFIDANFTQPSICLNVVAHECNISPNHLSFLFSKYVGITFIDYLTACRLSKAQELLIHTSIHISEISYAIGYNDSHYFSNIFKKHIGISPSEYRKQHR